MAPKYSEIALLNKIVKPIPRGGRVNWALAIHVMRFSLDFSLWGSLIS